VYGSLKRGQTRHQYLQQPGIHYLGVASTVADYKMYKLSGYPALIPVESGTGTKVWGELWEVPASEIPTLDGVEGVDKGLFRRDRVNLSVVNLLYLPQGEEIFKHIQSCTATTYFFAKPDLTHGAADAGDFWVK
jgi:gamma-glutamylcyclotransferase (GGCT)/AIG2-like uncharacterized protein YtfP